MSRFEKILLILIGLLVVLGAGWILFSWQTWRDSSAYGTPDGQQLNYVQAKKDENPLNPCSPPPGYTEESWREHMSHHPDQYKQCLDQ